MLSTTYILTRIQFVKYFLVKCFYEWIFLFSFKKLYILGICMLTICARCFMLRRLWCDWAELAVYRDCCDCSRRWLTSDGSLWLWIYILMTWMGWIRSREFSARETDINLLVIVCDDDDIMIILVSFLFHSCWNEWINHVYCRILLSSSTTTLSY